MLVVVQLFVELERWIHAAPLRRGVLVRLSSNVSSAQKSSSGRASSGQKDSGIHDTSFQFIIAKDVLTGGTTIFQGINKCITPELTPLSPSTTQIKVVASQSEKFRTV